jgi:glycosidase
VKINRFQSIWTLALVLALVSPLGLTPAAASVPVSAPAAAPTQPDIVVDGLIDAAYGPPVASDPAGDGNGNAVMDLLDLYVAEDASYLYFAFTINADINTTNWGKYALYVDTSNDASGATSDAWTRNVAVNDPHKPEYGLYSWVDCGSYDPSCTQVWAWNGSGWSGSGTLDSAAKATTGITSTLEWQIQKSRLGNPDEIWVEVWDTGGGSSDNAQDTINDPADDWNAADWSTTAVLDNSTYYDVQGGTPPQPGHDNSVWWGGLEHDSRSDFYRVPFGALPTETPYTLRFRTYADDVTGVKVRMWDTHNNGGTLYPMTRVTTIPGDPYDYDIWQLQLTTPDYLTVLYYRFIVTDGSDTDYYEDDDLFDGGLGQAYDTSPDYSWQIDVYDPAFTTPDWFKDAVVYQIFPDRFRNGVSANDPISGTFFYDETPGTLSAPQWNWIVPDPRVTGSPWEGSYSKLFYGGDLQGIIDKLDYLQDLGVTTLYLNPIFESPSNHKYDTTNYEQVDDNFGDLATFQALIAELDGRDMHLVLDGVFNHTSSDSKYFDRYGRYPGVGACEDVNSPYRDWYYFSPASPPGSGVCAGDTTYNAWWGYESLPKLNTTDEPEVRTYIYSDTNPSPPPPVATYWLEEGADGWRLDVAGDVDASFWRDWRPYIRAANPEAITIAEEWGDASRFILGDELDSTMNYRFRNAVIGLLRETNWQDTNSAIRALSISQFDSLLHSFEEDYPLEAFYALMNLVGSHDVNRVLIPLDQDGDPTDADYSDGKARLRVLALIQMTLPGAPTIYYGDEVGLVGYGDPAGGGVFYSDPYNRQPYPWPDEPGYTSLPAWRQQDTALLAYYSTLTGLRNDHEALRTGSFDTLLVDDTNDLYAYGRKLGNDVAIVVVNRSTTARGVAQAVTVDVSGYLPDGYKLIDELNGGDLTVTGGQIVLANLAPMSGTILTPYPDHQGLIPPDAPTSLAASEGDGEVQLTWDAVVDAVSYNVYRSYVTGGGYTRIATGTVTTAFIDTTVTNGRWYYYVVTALDINDNESARSNEAAALPHATIGWAGNLEPPSIIHTIGLTPTLPISAQVWIDGLTNAPGQGEGVAAEIGLGLTGTLTNTWEWAPMAYAADVGNNDQYTATLTPEMTGTFQYLARFSTMAGRDWTYAYTAGSQPGVLTVQPSADTTPPATPQNLAVADWSAEWIALEWDPVVGDPSLYAYDVYRSEPVFRTLTTEKSA